MNDLQRDERLLADLVEASETRLDPNAVAAGVRGPSPERADVASDPEAALVLRMVAEMQGRRRHVVWSAVAVAACLLVGVVLVAVRDGGEGTPLVPSERLVAAVHLLGHDAPDLFGDFALATDEELRAHASRVRGGTTWLSPRGSVLAAPDTLRWQRPKGTTRVRVTLAGPGVDWRQDVAADAVDAPPLGPGRYVVTLEPLTGFARQKTKRAFVVASDDARAQYERARAVWTQTAPEDLRDLIEAHFALRHGYLDTALTAARRAALQDVTGDLATPLVEALTP